jgi:methyltransferase family protein
MPLKQPPPPPRSDYHLSLSEGERTLSDNEAAALNYRLALTFDRDLPEAHLGLALLRMPGDGYLVWLERLYRALAPDTAIEIGVFQGASLALMQPPTIAIGVDPNPTVIFPLKTETHIFTETSDESFAAGRFEKLVGGRPLSVGFIDGLHLFEQALKDFSNLERCCGPRSVILFHDTVPLDEPTQMRTRETQFHTGDVWKTILCLKHYRPDLDIFTIATQPTGLTVVTGMDPTSRVLTERYDEAVARFMDASFSALEPILETMLNVVPNDWDTVRTRLEARGILKP